MEKEDARKKGVTALIMSILGIVICAPLGIVGIVFARQAKSVLVPGEEGYGQANAAEIVGWIAVGLWILGIIIYAIVGLST